MKQSSTTSDSIHDVTASALVVAIFVTAAAIGLGIAWVLVEILV